MYSDAYFQACIICSFCFCLFWRSSFCSFRAISCCSSSLFCRRIPIPVFPSFPPMLPVLLPNLLLCDWSFLFEWVDSPMPFPFPPRIFHSCQSCCSSCFPCFRFPFLVPGTILSIFPIVGVVPECDIIASPCFFCYLFLYFFAAL